MITRHHVRKIKYMLKRHPRVELSYADRGDFRIYGGKPFIINVPIRSIEAYAMTMIPESKDTILQSKLYKWEKFCLQNYKFLDVDERMSTVDEFSMCYSPITDYEEFVYYDCRFIEIAEMFYPNCRFKLQEYDPDSILRIMAIFNKDELVGAIANRAQ